MQDNIVEAKKRKDPTKSFVAKDKFTYDPYTYVIMTLLEHFVTQIKFPTVTGQVFRALSKKMLIADVEDSGYNKSAYNAGIKPKDLATFFDSVAKKLDPKAEETIKHPGVCCHCQVVEPGDAYEKKLINLECEKVDHRIHAYSCLTQYSLSLID